MIQTIHASVAGRARYKVPGLYRSPAVKQQLEAQLSHTEGIHQVSANPLTGNVLVLYDGNRSSTDIAAVIAQLVNEPFAGPPHSSHNGTAPPHKSGGALHTEPSPRQVSIPPQPRALRKLIARAQEQAETKWHCLPETEVLSSWQTRRDSGLSHARAQERLQVYGPNVLPEAVPRSELSILLDQLTSLPVALLAVSAGVSLFTGGVVDALVILGVVAANATIGYVTESQSEKTIHSLKHLVTPSALVLRDGQRQDISAAEVVPGDLLVLQPGTYVAADSRLIDLHRLSVDESTLTGESLPVYKKVPALTDTEVPLADRVNMVHMGTLVTGGQGLAVVVATGRFTEIGKIQALAGEAQAPETPMQRQLGEMGTQLVILSGAVCGAVFGIGVVRGYGALAMLDHFLQQDPQSALIAECAVATGILFIAARFASHASVDVPNTARQVIAQVGYDQPVFNSKTCSIVTSLKELPDEDRPAFDERELTNDDIERIAVKNQVTVFGFACDQTTAFLPLPIWLAHRLARRLTAVRLQKILPYLTPDGWTQVGVEYRDGRPARIHSLTVVASHNHEMQNGGADMKRLTADLRDTVVGPVFQDEVLQPDMRTQIFINPGGPFLIGGPSAHSGLTGRKNAIDTYGEYARHSGAALSGKDPTRIDRVGAYAARYAAKNVVAAGLATECEVQLSYSIGLARPVSIQVETFGTGRLPDEQIASLLASECDFRLAGILKQFRLRFLPATVKGGFYRKLAAYGHVGRMDIGLPWEVTDKAAQWRERYDDAQPILRNQSDVTV